MYEEYQDKLSEQAEIRGQLEFAFQNIESNNQDEDIQIGKASFNQTDDGNS